VTYVRTAWPLGRPCLLSGPSTLARIADAVSTPAPPARAAIIDATLRLIGERGVEAVTHRAVAREAGVGLAATTYWFASKAEIIEEALAHAAELEMDRLRRAAEDVDGLGASGSVWAEQLAGWLAEQLSDTGRAALVAQYQLQLQAAWSPRLAEVAARWTEQDRALARGMLERAGTGDPVRDAMLVVGAIEGLRLQWLAAGAPFDREEAAGVLRRLFAALTEG
jgi:TetR/AcrR family transcriptional regulator, regulator of biofilm formation and stress response